MSRNASHFRTALLVVTALSLVLVPASFAGKGGGKGGGNTSGGSTTTSSLSLVLLNSPDSLPNHGEQVTFTVSTTATDRPFVGLRCWQGSTWIYDAYVGYFEGAMFDQWFTLDSPYWNPSIDANCTARLFYYDNRSREQVLATLSFTAAP